MKKTLLTIFTVLILKSTGFAQIKKYSLIGVWQVEYPQLGDAWLANYRFFSNGTFKYTFNQYDDRGRIAAAKGIFKLHGDTLTLIIKTRIERIGGDLVGGSLGFQQDELVLEGTRSIEVKQKNTDPIDIRIEWINKKGVKAFKLQNNTYYLISSDPHNQDD